jgi:hypothetical protein
MNELTEPRRSYALQMLVYWLVVGLPLAWGVWKTILKLPALFQ